MPKLQDKTTKELKYWFEKELDRVCSKKAEQDYIEEYKIIRTSMKSFAKRIKMYRPEMQQLMFGTYLQLLKHYPLIPITKEDSFEANLYNKDKLMCSVYPQLSLSNGTYSDAKRLKLITIGYKEYSRLMKPSGAYHYGIVSTAEAIINHKWPIKLPYMPSEKNIFQMYCFLLRYENKKLSYDFVNPNIVLYTQVLTPVSYGSMLEDRIVNIGEGIQIEYDENNHIKDVDPLLPEEYDFYYKQAVELFPKFKEACLTNKIYDKLDN